MRKVARKTGKMCSTPVSVLKVNGQRYILTGLETGWVKNARAAGWGLLSYGRKKERVALIELPVEELRPSCGSSRSRFQVACQCLSAYSTCPAIQRRSCRPRHGVPCFALIMQMPTWLLQADLQDTA